MTFEYIIEKDNSTKKLNPEEENSLISKIASKFTSLNAERSTNLEMASNLANEVFFKNDFKSISDKSQKWKSKIKMCKTFMFYQTLKAFIWRNTYANVNSMFDVSGENHDSNNASNKQKAMLVDILEKMGYQKTCDQIIDNALLYGELISFTSWKKNYEEYRRPIDFFKNIFSQDIQKLPLIMDAISKGKNYWVDTKKIYDNPFIYPVNPADLVFDSSQKDNWDSCPKIYRTYKTPSEIINNKFYTLSEEQIDEIKNLVSDNDSKNTKDNVVKGSTIEVLEHWGDLKLSDGTLLKNWHAVVIARKYLASFGKNESIINPFSYGAFIVDPTTKRGISPLYSVLSLAHLQEDLMNRTCNLQALNENPPLLAPEGFFDEDEIDLYPGKIIEYGDNLSPSAAFQQLTFNPNVYLQDISFLNDLMAEVSGIFPNMIGAIETTATKTATEINTKTQGQMIRLSMLVDTINQDLIVPNVQKVAKLCADFKSGIETVFVNNKNQQEVIEIDDAIRQGDYKYMYSDSSMTALKSEQADMVVQAVGKFSNELKLNLEEIFIWYFEQKGVDNPERFLLSGVGINQGVGVNEGGEIAPTSQMLASAGVGVNEGVNAGTGIDPTNTIASSEGAGVNLESPAINPIEKPQRNNADVMEKLLPLLLEEAIKNSPKDEFLEFVANLKGKGKKQVV